jgi:hypothetical protein
MVRLRNFVALTALLACCCASPAEDLSGYSGDALYHRFCASCHGPKAEGDGPVAPALKVMVPDLTRIAKRHAGVFPEDQVRRIIDGRTVQPPHGARDMPVWGYEFGAALGKDSTQTPEKLIERLTQYLRSIQVK